MKCSLHAAKDNGVWPRILVVDDQPANVRLLELCLAEKYHVSTAASGLEAISAVAQSRFDLIVLDVMMPGINGFETLKRLKSMPNFGSTPVIFMTALSEQQFEMEGLSLGAMDYIVKPFVVPLVQLRIANILENAKLQQQLEMALDSAQLGLWEYDVCRGVVHMTPRKAVELSLTTADPTVDVHWEETVHPDNLAALRSAILAVAGGERGHLDIDIQLLDKSGRWIWVNLYGAPVRTGSCGQVARLTGTYREIESRKRIEASLAESERRLRLVMDATGEGIWDWDIVNQRVSHNASWCRMLGYDDFYLEHDIDFFKSLIHPDDQEYVARAVLDSITNDQPYLCEYRVRRANGDYIWIEDRGKVAARSDDTDATATRMVGSIKDISQKKAADTKIHQLAYYDFLTGLPNRRLLVDRIGQSILRNSRSGEFGALLFIDMDRFKQLNDTHGHDAGDAMLKQVATRLRSAVRKCDTVARLGGDEFVVLLNSLGTNGGSFANARMIANNILHALNQPYVIGDISYVSTPSIGATFFQGPPAETEELLKAADNAMYQAKAAGRNCLRFAEDLPLTASDVPTDPDFARRSITMPNSLFTRSLF